MLQTMYRSMEDFKVHVCLRHVSVHFRVLSQVIESGKSWLQKFYRNICPLKTSAVMISYGGSTAVKAHQKISLHVCTRQEHGKHTIHVHEVYARTGIMIRYSKDIGDTFTFSSTAVERTKHACMHGYGYVSRVIRELGVTSSSDVVCFVFHTAAVKYT